MAGVPDQAVPARSRRSGAAPGRARRRRGCWRSGPSAADDADQLLRISAASCSSSFSESAPEVGRRADPGQHRAAHQRIPFQKSQRQRPQPVAPAAQRRRAATASSASCRARRRLPQRPETRGTSIFPTRNPCRPACPAWSRPPGRRAGRRRSGTPGRRPCRNSSSASRLDASAPGDDRPHPQAPRGAGPRSCGGGSPRASLRRAVAFGPSAWRSAIWPPTIPPAPAASARPHAHGSRRRAGSDCCATTSKASVKQPVAGQDRRRLVERLVAGRPAAPQVVVVHRRQVVVDQRIGVHHLQRTGRRQRRLRLAPARLGRHQAEHRPEPLPPPPARCTASPTPAAPGNPQRNVTSDRAHKSISSRVSSNASDSEQAVERSAIREQACIEHVAEFVRIRMPPLEPRNSHEFRYD